IDVPSQPRSSNRRLVVSRSSRWRRSASWRVGRPPGPRRDSPLSSELSLSDIPALPASASNVNVTISFRCNRSSPVDRRVALIVVACAVALAGWWFLLRPQDAPVAEWQGYADADFVKVGPTQ